MKSRGQPCSHLARTLPHPETKQKTAREPGRPLALASLMRIGIVGGAECVENEYRRVIKNSQHELEFHSGHMTSGGARSLQTLINRCDLVVIVTDVNSHAAVGKARRLARAAGRSPIYARRFGVRGLSALIEEAGQTLAAPG